MKAVIPADANRHFSRLLRDVAGSEIITVLSRGKPAATIAPASSGNNERLHARLQLLIRLRKQKRSVPCACNRDELYEG